MLRIGRPHAPKPPLFSQADIDERVVLGFYSLPAVEKSGPPQLICCARNYWKKGRGEEGGFGIRMPTLAQRDSFWRIRAGKEFF